MKPMRAKEILTTASRSNFKCKAELDLSSESMDALFISLEAASRHQRIFLLGETGQITFQFGRFSVAAAGLQYLT